MLKRLCCLWLIVFSLLTAIPSPSSTVARIAQLSRFKSSGEVSSPRSGEKKVARRATSGIFEDMEARIEGAWRNSFRIFNAEMSNSSVPDVARLATFSLRLRRTKQFPKQLLTDQSLLNNAITPTAFTKQRDALWPGSRFTERDRERAIMRGLQFIYRTALKRKNFEDYGHDYLWCFYTLSTAVKDENVRREARRMGLERAAEWRREHHSVPLSADATLISELVFGNDAAESLGLKDEKFKAELKQIAPRFKARAYLLFDPLTEPPPVDVPDKCDYCGAETNSRGSLVCHVCKHRLKMRTRYDVWYDALITTYSGDRAGITLGAHYVDVLKWLPTLRPYNAKPSAKKDGEFYDTVYAITHIVYTLNNYSQYRLSPQLLPQEFEFLKANLRAAIREKDTDMLGEFMDTLRAFGLTTNDSLIRRGMEFYLAHQNADGSWGKRHQKDIYLRYHPTWNAIAGLSEYAWTAGEGLSFPEVKPLLEEWVKESPDQLR